jgi:hypothetical protein
MHLSLSISQKMWEAVVRLSDSQVFDEGQGWGQSTGMCYPKHETGSLESFGFASLDHAAATSS